MNILKLEKPELIFTCNSSRAIPALEGIFFAVIVRYALQEGGLGKKKKLK